MNIGVAHLTALDLPPNDFIAAASRAGFRSVGLRVSPAIAGGAAYPLHHGTSAHRLVRDTLNAEGVTLNDIEFVQVDPQFNAGDYEALIHGGAELGAQSLNVAGDDSDFARLADHLSSLCVLAAGYGVRVDLEFMRWRHAGSLVAALQIAERIKEPNFGILLDTLHLYRAGGNEADLDLPGVIERIHHVQLSDTYLAAVSSDEDAMAEARSNRAPVGEGTLPMAALRSHLPKNAAFSIEFPNQAMGVEERLTKGYVAAAHYLSVA